jgi:hypothetical protein
MNSVPLAAVGTGDNRSAESFLERAMDDCRGNIRRHSYSAVFELVGLLIVIALLGYVVNGLARQQGAQNDSSRDALRENLKASKENMDGAHQRYDEYKRLLDGETGTATTSNAPTGSGPATGPTASAEPTAAEKLRRENLEKYVANQKKTADDGTQEYAKAVAALNTYRGTPLLTDREVFGLGVLFIVLISVFIGLYRVHIREITKNEQLRLGFLRIGVAAANAQLPGYDAEVRSALVKAAFDLPPETGLLRRERKIESPLPGHASSDFVTAILNKVLEQLDVVVKPKEGS